LCGLSGTEDEALAKLDEVEADWVRQVREHSEAVAPAVVAAPAPAPVETDWSAGDLRSAVQLVIEQMKSKHVVELTIQADGTVHYRREIIERGTIEL